MDKILVFAALKGIVALILIGIVMFFVNYSRYAKQKDWEDATKGLSPNELTTAVASRDLKEAQVRRRVRIRMYIYAVTFIAIMASTSAYLSYMK